MFCDMFLLLPCRLILGDGTDMHSCSCKAFAKKGYCKHILFVLKKINRDSATIVVERTFAYSGNTRRTRQMRGRVADAVPALQRNT